MGDYFNKKTNTREKVSLVEHQTKFIKQLILSNKRGAICFHGTGTGKTLSAVVSAHWYLKMHPENKVLFICPSAVLFNFINSMIQYGLDIQDNRYRFYTYDKYIRNKELGDNALVIIDEAHNLRTKIIAHESTDDEGNTKTNIDKGARAKKIIQYATENCHKVLLLTATPFVNTLYYIKNLIAMIENREPRDELYYDTICANDKTINTYFKYKISHYEKAQDNINFPERKEGFMNYNNLIKDKGYDQVNYKEMTNEMINAYNELGIIFMDDETASITNSLTNSLTKKERAYYSGNKKISNNASSNRIEIKVNFIFEKILDNEFSKNIVYSSLYDNGVQLLMSVLDKNNIGYKLITGRQTTSEKQESVNYYNGYIGGRINKNVIEQEDTELKQYENDTYRVLIITKAGSEGVDTINTNNIYLMEPNWNEATTEQIIARAIRYKSHDALLKSQRFVNVYRLLLVDKSNKPMIDKLFHPDFSDWDIVCKAFKDDRVEANRLKAEKKGTKRFLIKKQKLL